MAEAQRQSFIITILNTKYNNTILIVIENTLLNFLILTYLLGGLSQMLQITSIYI
jgi:hypothetical protein